MTKHKSDVPDPEGGNQAPEARGGAAGEDRSKDMTSDQSFANQKEGRAAGEGETSGEQERQDSR